MRISSKLRNAAEISTLVMNNYKMTVDNVLWRKDGKWKKGNYKFPKKWRLKIYKSKCPWVFATADELSYWNKEKTGKTLQFIMEKKAYEKALSAAHIGTRFRPLNSFPHELPHVKKSRKSSGRRKLMHRLLDAIEA